MLEVRRVGVAQWRNGLEWALKSRANGREGATRSAGASLFAGAHRKMRMEWHAVKTSTPIAAVFALLAVLASAPNARAQQIVPAAAQYETGRAGVEDVIRQSRADVSVAFRTLDSNQEVFVEADKETPATSQWVEIPVMIELYAEAQARALQLDDRLLVHNSFRSVDGTVYHLDPARDPDPEFYHAIGRRVTLRDLESRMMRQDSQLATNLLLEMLGLDRIDARLANLHAGGIKLRHAFQDPAAKNLALRNTATAHGMMEVLWALANNRAASEEASQEMVGVLANSKTANSGPFAGQRTSGTIGTYQEALIVYGAHSFAMAVVVRGLEAGPSTALIARISHALSAGN